MPADLMLDQNLKNTIYLDMTDLLTKNSFFSTANILKILKAFDADKVLADIFKNIKKDLNYQTNLTSMTTQVENDIIQFRTVSTQADA